MELWGLGENEELFILGEAPLAEPLPPPPTDEANAAAAAVEYIGIALAWLSLLSDAEADIDDLFGVLLDGNSSSFRNFSFYEEGKLTIKD